MHTHVCYYNNHPQIDVCSDGRVVKVLDLKSNGVSLRRFKSCSLCAFLFYSNIFIDDTSDVTATKIGSKLADEWG